MRKPCSTPGCGRDAVARGMCNPCYQRAYLRNSARWRVERRGPLSPAPLCSSDGCPADAGASGFCPRHSHLIEQWNAMGDELAVVCSFRDCGEIIDPGTYGWESPTCPRHLFLVQQATELEEWGVTRDAAPYLWCPDWVWAKWISVILGFTDANRELLPKVVGDTRLFSVLTSTLADLYRQLPFLDPKAALPLPATSA